MTLIGFAEMVNPENEAWRNRKNSFLSASIRHKSISQATFDLLQTAIFDSRIEPNLIYNEASIARELGVSTSPVRDAVVKLTGKGFIEILPRRGIKLTELGKKPFAGLFELRRSLERAVLLKVVPKIEDRNFEYLSSLLHEYKNQTDNEAGIKSDNAIHRYLASLTRNQYIIYALASIEDQWDWISRRALLAESCIDVWKTDHFRIHAYLERRDAEGAWQAMKDHIDHFELCYCQSQHRFQRG